MGKSQDPWNSGDPYEYFMGRWSSMMAPVFLKWLNCPTYLSWVDLGCGTGALSEAISANCKPVHVSCVDPSESFLDKTKKRLAGNADFNIGTASDIPKPNDAFDMVVSGLALNFFPDLPAAFSEMKRVVKNKGTIAAYVWDYSDRMDFLRIFWDAAYAVNPESKKLDEGIRFPICNTDKLKAAFQDAGLNDIQTSTLDIYTIFKNFEDYWNPFLGGQGPAPGYLVGLSKDEQDKVKNTIYRKLSFEPDGSIKLLARVIAVRGIYNQ